MLSAAEKPTAVRPGWLMPVLGLGGLAAGIKGLTMLHAANPGRSFCRALVLFGSLAPHELTSGLRANCGRLDSMYDRGVVIALVGLAVVVVAGLGLARRSKQAAQAGAPWPLRRATRSAARWIDVHLPGGGGAEPRLRPGYLTALGALVLTVAVGVAVSAWTSYRRAQHLADYNRTQQELVSLALPTSLHRVPSPSPGCAGPVCARSSLNPPEVEPLLRRLLNAVPNPTLTTGLACAGPCPITLYGQLNGYPVVGIAFWRLVLVRHRGPPSGAISVPLRVRGVHEFFLGSNITIEAEQPNPNGSG